jgi:hypothetical protein
MTERTVLTSNSLLVYVRKFLFHPDNLLLIFCTRVVKLPSKAF